MKHDVDISEMVRLYDGGMTTRQIADAVGIPHRTATRYLKKAGASLRNPGNPQVKQLADKAWLQAAYWDEGLSTTQIGSRLGCGASIVSASLRKHGIATRDVGSEKGRKMSRASRAKMSRAKRGMFLGANNPNWKGGTANGDPERNRMPSKLWSRAVKDRDGHECQHCGATEQLHAHHVKSWRHHPELRYELSNGLTLCKPCHERVHKRKFVFGRAEISRKSHERTAPHMG